MTISFDDMMGMMLDTVGAEGPGLGSSVVLRNPELGAVNAAGGQTAGTPVEWNFTATTTAHEAGEAQGGVGQQPDVWETVFWIKAADIAAASPACTPRAGYHVAHGAKRFEVVRVTTRCNGLDVGLLCRSRSKKQG
ncbi:MAG TPA: hypothetical protein VFF65_07635 [Phycisphaerales bacterium]|nr:hypothetical protein [Phycisphaerales bacterium]